jgi:hypothetical protein
MDGPVSDPILQRAPINLRQAIEDTPAGGQMRKRLRIYPSQVIPDDGQHLAFAFGERDTA